MDWTKEDFECSSAPYESVYAIEDPFKREQAIKQMQVYAKKVGFTGFGQIYKAFQRSLEHGSGASIVSNYTNFDGQPLELECGGWNADDTGVYRLGGMYGERIVACPHPILPVERMTNIDTGEEKLRLAYKKGRASWRTLIADKRTLASASKVTELAGQGISVTSDNAKNFIRYIFDLEALNHDQLPERLTIGRLGHIPGIGFSPYFDGLTFDGNESYDAMFKTVTPKGSYEKWKQEAARIRRTCLPAKMLLAASFASPLLDVIGALPFFVHLWGVDSGTGKTVALMLAASVWGAPSVGDYIKTFNSTDVGMEVAAAFLNHLPFCMDELQLIKDAKGRANPDVIVYKLAEGVGRTRGTKNVGISRTLTWKNTVLTTGETPLVGANAGAGAVNRVINIECVTGSPAIPMGEGIAVANLVRQNYGHAGKSFVKRLYDEKTDLELIRSMYESTFRMLSERDTTEKQAMAAAAIMTADNLMCSWIFDDRETPISVSEMSQFLASRQAVSAGDRAYEYIMSWLAMNRPHFLHMSDQPELWGELQHDRVYIISAKLREALEKEGYSYNAILSWLDSAGKLAKKGGDRSSRKDALKKINGIATRCVCICLEEDFDSE